MSSTHSVQTTACAYSNDICSDCTVREVFRQVVGHRLDLKLMNVLDHVMQNLVESGFDQPTPIQAITWPVTMSGRNVIGIAQTGSGKTLSVGAHEPVSSVNADNVLFIFQFLLPGLVHMADQERPGRRQGPIVSLIFPFCLFSRAAAQNCFVGESGWLN